MLGIAHQLRSRLVLRDWMFMNMLIHSSLNAESSPPSADGPTMNTLHYSVSHSTFSRLILMNQSTSDGVSITAIGDYLNVTVPLRL